MALDVNLWNAIKQESFYDRKKQNAAENMQLQQKLMERQQRKEAEQLQLQESREIFLDQIQQSINQFAPADAERIKALEVEQRQAVYEAVKQSGGDMKRFYMMGGHKILRNYKNSIMNSEQVTKAIQNKGRLQQIAKDQSEGKLFHDVTVDVTTESGKKETRTVSVNEMMDYFQNGYIDSVAYNGAEDPVKVDMSKFTKSYHSGSPYKYTRVSKQDLVHALQLQGQSPDIAARVAEHYVTGYDPDTKEPLTDGFWGLKDFDYTTYSKLYGTKNGYNRGGGKVNSRWAATAQKVAPIIQTIPHMVKKGDSRTGFANWWNNEEQRWEDKIMMDYTAPAETFNGILKAINIGVDAEGRLQDENFDTPMLLNLSNGKGFKGLERHHYKFNRLTPSTIKVIADKEDPSRTQLMLEANILINEETMEDVLDWEDWFIPTTKGEREGMMTTVDNQGTPMYRDLTWEEESSLGLDGDWRSLKVGIPLPADEVGIANMNRAIGFEQGKGMGEPLWQDWISQQMTFSGGQEPFNIQGDLKYGNYSQGQYVENANDVRRQKEYQANMQEMFNNNPQMKAYMEQINQMQQQMQSTQTTQQGTQNNNINLNPFQGVSVPQITKQIQQEGISPQELLLILNQLKQR